MGLKKELYGPLHESPFVQCKSIYFTLNLGLREGMGGGGAPVTPPPVMALDINNKNK